MKPKHRTSEDIKQEITELKKKLLLLEHKELVEAEHREAIDAVVAKGGLDFGRVILIYTRKSETNKRRGIRHSITKVKIGHITDKTVKLMYCGENDYIADIVTMGKSEAYYKLHALNKVYNNVEEIV